MSRMTETTKIGIEIDRKAWEERGEIEPIHDGVKDFMLAGEIAASLEQPEHFITYEVQEPGSIEDRTEQIEAGTLHVLGTKYACMEGHRAEALDTVILGTTLEGAFSRIDASDRAWLVSA